MADNNKIIIEITTNDKGTTAAIKNNKKLKDSIDQTNKSTKNAKKTGDGFHSQQKSLYQTNLSSAKGFSKQAQAIGTGGSSGLVGAYATLAANVFAATAAFNALRGAAQVQTLIEGFTFLGNAVGQSSLQIANGLKEITNNAISLEDALRASAIALTSGFNTDQISKLAEVARNASIALGRNMGDSIDRLFRGVAKLEPEILDELGIMVRLDTAVSKYAATLGKSKEELTDFERRQAFLNETLTQGALKYGDLSNAVDPNAYDKLAGSLQDLANTGLELINKFLNPFIKILASSSGALIGGIILFGSTILTTMIPALGQMAERQTAVANTAKIMAAEQAKAGKQAAQLAKIDFVRGSGSAAKTTKGKDFTSVTSLKKALKSGKVEASDFDKALKQVNNTRARTADIAKNNKTQNTAAHIQRMTELEALENQILGVQQAEMGRSGSAGASAIAGGEATGQEGVSGSMAIIGGSSATGGFSEALKGVKQYRADQMDAFKESGKLSKGFKAMGASIGRAFGVAGVGARLFGAALMNAIPIIGQVLFFGGLLISFLMSFKGEASAAEKAQTKLSETVDTAKEKFKQLHDTNKELINTLDDLEDSFKAVAIAARSQKNEIVVTAGVATEARLNFSALLKELDDAKISRFGLAMRKIGTVMGLVAEVMGKGLLASLRLVFPELERMLRLLSMIGIISMDKIGDATEHVFGKTQIDRQTKFQNAIKASEEQINKLKGESAEMAKAFDGFDPAESFRVLESALDDAGNQALTFAQAAEIVEIQFQMITSEVETTSKTLTGLGTAYMEVGKVINKNIDGILKKNAFDKIKGTVQGLNNSLKELAEGTILSDNDLMNQIALATKEVGVEMSTFGVTVESVRANLEAGEAPYQQLEENLGKLATMTRQTKIDQKDLAMELAATTAQAKDTKAFDDYTLKLENLARVGKFEVGIVDNFNRAGKVAENAKKLAEDTLLIKNAQIDAEFELELFKLKVFKEMTGNKDLSAEMESSIEKIKAVIKLRKKQNELERDGAVRKADADEKTVLAKAGQEGTLGERSTTAAAALNDPENTTAGRMEAVAGTLSPMMDSLKALGPEGEAVSMAMQGILSIGDAFAMSGEKGLTMGDKLEAVGSVINAVSGMMAANSKAQLKEIDNQISAEKNRDGKSKESLARIAGLEKKKDQMARKAFEQGKKMKIASAIISTSAAIAGQLGADPQGPWNVPLAIMMGALGMAQVAIIKKQQYQGGASGGGAAVPQEISVGKRNNNVDVSKSASSGELSFLRGEKGMGSNANNFRPGGAAGMRKGYANGGEILVGERGPEVIAPTQGGYEVTPNDQMNKGGTTNANFTINAVDAAGVEEVLAAQRGNIIGMIREAAHEHGEEFIEAVNTGSYGGG